MGERRDVSSVHAGGAAAFPGTLWYVYENTRNPKVLEYARMYVHFACQWENTTDNHDVGFMLYCSFGKRTAPHERQSLKRLLLTQERSWRRASNPRWSLIRSWDHNRDKTAVSGYHRQHDEPRTADVEPPNVRVTKPSAKWQSLHADKTLEHHFRPDFSSWHVVS